MEQLANMPVWAQILSMGSFMFASGVLMTRIPLAPALILSFFYLYGVFGDLSTMPSFTLKHPWVWTSLSLVLLLLLAFLWTGFNSALSSASGPDSMGLGFAGVWLIIFTVGAVGVAILLSAFPALFKWIKLLVAVSHTPWQTVLYVVLFVGGIGSGIFSLGGMDTIRNMFEGNVFGMSLYRFLFVAFIAMIVCGCSLSSISFGVNTPTGILVCLVAILGTVMLGVNGMSYAKYQHIHSDKQQPLLEAAGNGNVEQTKQLLAEGLNVNARDRSQRTPLFEASNNGHLEVVQELIKAGADVNVADKFGTTPLSIAALRGNLPIVKELLKAGANVNVLTEEGSPLVQAIHGGFLEVATTLVEAGADVNLESRYPYRSALAEAAWQDGSIELVKLLLQKGANVNQMDFGGKTPLQLALGRKNSEQASRLIYAAGGRLGKISSDDQTKPMMDHACSSGFTEIVEQLLQAGVKPTPHHVIMAAQEGQTKVLKQLVATGLDINQPDEDGNYPFLYAVGQGHLEAVQFFVEHGADLTVEKVQKSGGTVGPALVLASLSGHLPIVKYLVEQKADVNITNHSGNTPLDVAAAKGHIEIVRFLLQTGADVNQQDKNKNTALMIATSSSHTDVALFLIEKGADVNRHNKHQSTALTIAGEEGSLRIVKALLKAGADVKAVDNDGANVIIDTAYGAGTGNDQNRPQIISILVAAGADVNYKDVNGKTALHWASERGAEDIIKALLQAGTGINETDKDGKTPLALAKEKGHTEVVKLLQSAGAKE